MTKVHLLTDILRQMEQLTVRGDVVEATYRPVENPEYPWSVTFVFAEDEVAIDHDDAV